MNDAAVVEGPEPPRTVWSCLLDDTPAIWRSFPVWLATITRLGGVRCDDLIVHHVCDLPAPIDGLLDELDVRRRRVRAFDHRVPHANKITQCSTDFGTADRVVLTDVDLVFLAPLPLDRVSGAIAGKIVDGPNPALSRLREFFEDGGLALPETTTASYRDGDGVEQSFTTLRSNLNGGLYVIERELVAPLGQAWDERTRQLLGRSDLDRGERFHTDQIAMAMAIAETGIDVQLLPASWNFPTHVGNELTPVPFVLHHHDHLEHALAQLEAAAPTEARAVTRALDDVLDRLRATGAVVTSIGRSRWQTGTSTMPTHETAPE